MVESGRSRCLAAGKDEELKLDLVLNSRLHLTSTPDLLSVTVARALDEVAARIVNDLVYP
jgi:hypothetical protein